MEQLPPEVYAEDQRPMLWALSTIMRVLAVSAVILRIVARRVGGTKLWWDDWIIIAVTFAITLPETGLEYAEIALGCGLHLPRVLAESPQNVAPFLKVIYADALTYPLVITPIKASFLMLYIRLFGINRRFTIWCYFLLAVSVTWGVVTFLLFTFQCHPVSDGWSVTRQGCMQFAPLFVGTNIPNVVIDFLILGTPVPVIWHLKLPTAKKLVINGILAIGTVEVILSIIRVTKLGVLTFEDGTWDNASALLWSFVECNVGTICCCLPVYGPLLPRGLREKMASRGTGKGDKYYDLSDVQRGPTGSSPPRTVNSHLSFSQPQPYHQPSASRDWKDIRMTTDIQTNVEARGPAPAFHTDRKQGRVMGIAR